MCNKTSSVTNSETVAFIPFIYTKSKPSALLLPYYHELLDLSDLWDALFDVNVSNVTKHFTKTT